MRYESEGLKNSRYKSQGEESSGGEQDQRSVLEESRNSSCKRASGKEELRLYTTF